MEKQTEAKRYNKDLRQHIENENNRNINLKKMCF